MKKQKIYYEKCTQSHMSGYPFFETKLNSVENVIKSERTKNAEVVHKSKSLFGKFICSHCKPTYYYQLGNIVWGNTISHIISEHQRYPSEYFISVVLCTNIANGQIVNPPVELTPRQISQFRYVPLHHNKLLILDALLNQGSFPRYQNGAKFIFSEHSGGLTVKNSNIDNIIVFTDTNRTDLTDDTIFLPNNSDKLVGYDFLFHTHPNTIKYAGRINEGILYEFPSANDIFNFVKYRTEGQAQASLILSPEGTYVIRPVVAARKIHQFDTDLFYYLKKFIIKLEKSAIRHNNRILSKLQDPDIFHKHISTNYRYINLYNRLIRPANLFIEYYPREKKNGEWVLKQIHLQWIDTHN